MTPNTTFPRRAAWLVALTGALCAPSAHAQTLYALNAFSHTISQISPGGAVVNIALNGGSGGFPSGLAIDTSGHFFVSYEDNTISKFDGAGNALSFALTGVGLDIPEDLVFDKAGNLYTSNLNNNTISKITPAGVVSTFATIATPDYFGLRLAFDAQGVLYCSGGNGAALTRFDSAGNELGFPALNGGGLDEFNPLGGLAFDGAGNLYAANANNNTLVQIAPSGAATLFATGAGFETLAGLVRDPAGNFYSAGINGNAISKFDSAGNIVPFPLTGDSLDFPVDVAFAPQSRNAAPEPATLCLVATGLLGLVCRRRRPHGEIA